MPASFRRRNAAQRHFSGLIVSAAIGLVMQILEFSHAGKARLQHFHIGLRRNRFEIVGRELERKAIHRLAPGPETVGSRSRPLRQSNHQSLMGMRVNIGNRGDGNARNQCSVFRVRRNTFNHPILIDGDTPRPSASQKM